MSLDGAAEKQQVIPSKLAEQRQMSRSSSRGLASRGRWFLVGWVLLVCIVWAGFFQRRAGLGSLGSLVGSTAGRVSCCDAFASEESFKTYFGRSTKAQGCKCFKGHHNREFDDKQETLYMMVGKQKSGTTFYGNVLMILMSQVGSKLGWTDTPYDVHKLEGFYTKSWSDKDGQRHLEVNKRTLNVTFEGGDLKGWSKHSMPPRENAKVLFLARDPRATTVSWYHYLEGDDKPFEPSAWSAGTYRDYVDFVDEGLYSWDRWAGFHLTTYRMLHEHPLENFREVLVYFGVDEGDVRNGMYDDDINEALELSSVDQMRELEQQGKVDVGGHCREGCSKVRNAEVDGFRDEVSSELLSTDFNICRQSLVILSLFAIPEDNCT